MKKRIFLVDLENVGRGGWDPFNAKDMQSITQYDTFVLFHNTLRGTISTRIQSAFVASGAQLRIIEIQCGAGKNAMDFCLATQLGYLLAQEPNAQYIIVSNDRGYEACIDFAKTIGADVTIARSVNGAVAKEEDQLQEREELKRLLPDANKKVIAIAQQGLVRTSTCSDYHNFLQKRLKNDFKMVYDATKHLVTCY